MLAHISMHIGFPTFGVFEISYWEYLFGTFDGRDLHQRCSFNTNLVRDWKFILNILVGMQGHACWQLHHEMLESPLVFPFLFITSLTYMELHRSFFLAKQGIISYFLCA